MFEFQKHGNLEYYTIDSFLKDTKHCFTTRRGGVSKDEFSSMNLRFNCNDSRENVLKNFEIICNEIDIDYKRLILSHQVHEDKVVPVTSADCGNGIVYPNRFESADALICGEKNVPIATFFADCVPIFFLDPKNKVIALAHSGWKGTVKNIAAKTVDAFEKLYNSRTEDILCAIGPSIGVCCFEVGDEVSDVFFDKFGDSVLEKHADRWHVNLQKAIELELRNAGAVHIDTANICTACNSNLLFSHRKTNGRRGNMAAIAELR